MPTIHLVILHITSPPSHELSLTGLFFFSKHPLIYISYLTQTWSFALVLSPRRIFALILNARKHRITDELETNWIIYRKKVTPPFEQRRRIRRRFHAGASNERGDVAVIRSRASATLIILSCVKYAFELNWFTCVWYSWEDTTRSETYSHLYVMRCLFKMVDEKMYLSYNFNASISHLFWWLNFYEFFWRRKQRARIWYEGLKKISWLAGICARSQLLIKFRYNFSLCTDLKNRLNWNCAQKWWNKRLESNSRRKSSSHFRS